MPSTMPIMFCETARENTQHQLNNAFGRITEDEFVNAKPPKKYGADACRDLLIRTHSLPVSHSTRVNCLHWLVSAADYWSQRSLAVGTILRKVVIDATTFSAISTHLLLDLPQPSTTKSRAVAVVLRESEWLQHMTLGYELPRMLIPPMITKKIR